MKDLYFYKAKVVHVYDGDTLTVDVDLGFHVSVRQTLRVFGINTPEIRGGTDETKAAGIAARDFVREAVGYEGTGGGEILVETVKDSKGKYGRYLAEVWIQQGDTIVTKRALSEMLLTAGHAVAVEY